MIMSPGGLYTRYNTTVLGQKTLSHSAMYGVQTANRPIWGSHGTIQVKLVTNIQQ